MERTITTLVLVICVYEVQTRSWVEPMAKATLSEQELEFEDRLSEDENVEGLFRRPCKRQSGRPGCKGFVKEPFRTPAKRTYESPIFREEIKSEGRVSEDENVEGLFRRPCKRQSGRPGCIGHGFVKEPSRVPAKREYKSPIFREEIKSEGRVSEDENVEGLFRRPCKRQSGRPGCIGHGFVKEPSRVPAKREYKSPIFREEMKPEGRLSEDENVEGLFRRPCKRQSGQPGCNGFVKEPSRIPNKREYKSPIF